MLRGKKKVNRLSDGTYPNAGDAHLVFRTKDEILHRGRYIFDDFSIDQLRWIDQVGTVFTSDVVTEWEYSL